jgi:hypothetical protein
MWCLSSLTTPYLCRHGLAIAQRERLLELGVHRIRRTEPLPDGDAHRSTQVLDHNGHDVPPQQQRYHYND